MVKNVSCFDCWCSSQHLFPSLFSTFWAVTLSNWSQIRSFVIPIMCFYKQLGETIFIQILFSFQIVSFEDRGNIFGIEKLSKWYKSRYPAIRTKLHTLVISFNTQILRVGHLFENFCESPRKKRERSFQKRLAKIFVRLHWKIHNTQSSIVLLSRSGDCLRSPWGHEGPLATRPHICIIIICIRIAIRTTGTCVLLARRYGAPGRGGRVRKRAPLTKDVRLA